MGGVVKAEEVCVSVPVRYVPKGGDYCRVNTHLYDCNVWPLACSTQYLQSGRHMREVAAMVHSALHFCLDCDFLEMDSLWLGFTSTFYYYSEFVIFEVLVLFCFFFGKWCDSVVLHPGAAGTCCKWTLRFLTPNQYQLTVRWEVCWKKKLSHFFAASIGSSNNIFKLDSRLHQISVIHWNFLFVFINLICSVQTSECKCFSLCGCLCIWGSVMMAGVSLHSLLEWWGSSKERHCFDNSHLSPQAESFCYSAVELVRPWLLKVQQTEL